MNNAFADISVIVPLYNHERYIEAALDSVLGQSLCPREIIIVDDGSNDRSYDLVTSRYGGDRRMIIWSKPNSGAHQTINAGIHRATSSYIAILNSDDIYEPERLKVCLQLLEKNKEAQVACTGISFIDGAGKRINNDWYDRALAFYQSDGDLALSLINGNFLMTTSNFIIRRSAFEKFGYFGNFRYAHDLAFLLRLLAQGGQVAIDPKPLMKYRIHTSNTISEGTLKVKLELAAVIAEYLTHIYRTNSGRVSNEYLERLYRVLDTHNLSRMLFPLMGMIASTASPGVGIDKLITDPELSRSLMAIVK
jgi:glycosyltransferase involved in cell wall biosynthesis